MRLGKRERQERKELMRWREQCRQRHNAVMHPHVNEAACNGQLASHLKVFLPSQKAKPRVPGGWNSSKARSFAQRPGKVYS